MFAEVCASVIYIAEFPAEICPNIYSSGHCPFSLSHLALAAARAISVRRSGESLLALALPPFLPSSLAAVVSSLVIFSLVESFNIEDSDTNKTVCQCLAASIYL